MAYCTDIFLSAKITLITLSMLSIDFYEIKEAWKWNLIGYLGY